VKIIHHSSG